MKLTVPPYMAALIVARKVTQHRRPVDNRRPRVVRRTHVGGSQVHVSRPWAPPAPGQVVAVHLSTEPAGTAATCHIEVTGHRRQRHGDITAADLHALEAATLAEHARRWLAIHDEGWLWKTTEDDREHSDTLTTCVRHLSDEQAEERFRARWADRHVWVLDLQLVAEPEVYLAPAGRHGGADEHGHTHSETNAIDAGHRVDPADLNTHWARDAVRRHDQDVATSDAYDLAARDISRPRDRPPGSRRAA